MGTRIRRHGPERERGAAAVEFALVSGLLLALVFGTIQYGLYFWSLQSGAQAVREAARQAAVGSLSCTQFRAAVSNNARGAQSGTITATRTYYTDATMASEVTTPVVGNVVRVAVTFKSIDLHIPLVPFIRDGQVGEVSVARVENITADSVKCT